MHYIYSVLKINWESEKPEECHWQWISFEWYKISSSYFFFDMSLKAINRRKLNTTATLGFKEMQSGI